MFSNLWIYMKFICTIWPSFSRSSLMALLTLNINICWGLAFVDFQIWCSRWIHLSLNYLKLWKERFKNTLFIVWAYTMLFTKSKPLPPVRKEKSSFEIWMHFHFHDFPHAIICPFVPKKESGWMEAIDSSG